jgi:hypothetical protein
LISWFLNHANDEEDELLTRNVDQRKKLLTRKSVGIALKNVASELQLDPKRFSTHSLRSGFATMTSKQTAGTAEDRSKLLTRAGWSLKHYIKTVDQEGALAYPTTDNGMAYLNRLAPRQGNQEKGWNLTTVSRM